MKLYQGDCLKIMPELEAGSVDMVLCDLPYGTTRCAWDKVIPMEPLWEQYHRICKPNAAILLFSAQPFTTDLICSNRKLFRYEIIWEKTVMQGFLNANRMPMRGHENILVFYQSLPTYNPQKHPSQVPRKLPFASSENRSSQYGRMGQNVYTDDGTRYPYDVIHFSNQNGAVFGRSDGATKHPTQKPVALLEYLVKTYTNPGDTVLDNCMGSGSTGVACANTGRDFIGIELDPGYFETAKRRIEEANAQIRL